MNQHNSRRYSRLTSSAIFLLLVAGLITVFNPFSRTTTAAQQPDQARIAAGRKIFAGACSNSYCHGSEGVGGGAPKLQNRSLTAEHVTRVINEGVKGTNMPSFKGVYSSEEIASLVAYVMSLSANKAGAAFDPHPNPEANKDAAKPANTAEAGKPALGAADAEFLKGGDAKAGRELFFDPGVVDSCRVCHTFNGRGGKVGPDLSGIGTRPAEEIFRSITSPGAAIVANYETIAITTRGGERTVGVKRGEDNEAIRVYDVSSPLPVLRTFPKAEVVKTERLDASAMPDHYGKKYSRRQLIDLVTFLKTAQ